MTRKLTKFLLHGGNIVVKAKNNAKFFNELARGLKPGSTIVCVYAVYPEAEWELLFAADQSRINEIHADKHLNVICASSDPAEFTKQIQSSQVVYLSEGSEQLLKKFLRSVTDLQGLLSGKTVAGVGAGANVLCKHYYSLDREKIEDGLGILYAMSLCHYDYSRRPAADKLTAFKPRLDLILIPETRYYEIIKYI